MDVVQLKSVLERTNLWTGFEGPCGATVGGELTVLFEKKSKRFVIGKVVDDVRCVAVSVSEDASGAYDRYASAVTAVFACDESESTGYTYAALGDPLNDFGASGHYTQLVWANTSLIGCGVKHCTTNTPFPGFPEWDFVVCSTPANCNDDNPCTNDICNSPGTPASSCSHVNNNAACDDGNACTGPDVCAEPASCVTAQGFDAVAAPALPSGWTTTVTGTGTLWTTVDTESDTAPNSAFVSDGPSVADQLLVSPTIAISSPVATLTFKSRWSFEFEDPADCYDGGVLEIKIGAGAFADIVIAGGSFVGGGYTGTVSSSFANPLGGRSAWCGVSAGYPTYATTTVNLPAAAAGESIQLKWRVGTDTSVGAPGQNIDSIVLNDGCTAVCNAGPPVGAPAEVANVVAAPNKTTFNWPTVASATRYDAVRGGLSTFPVGPGGAGEVCFPNLSSPTLVDATVPAAGTGFWFLARAENSCANGFYGTQGVNGVPGAARVTTTCP